MKFVFNPKLFNPLYWHLMPLLLDVKIRYIFVEGGSSAAKTFTIAQAILIYCMTERKNALVFRRFHVHIKDSVYASFKNAAAKLHIDEYFIFQEDLIKCKINGARIVFKGLDNEESIKGMEDFDIVYNNEWNQFLFEHWNQQRKRLRGRLNQKFICDWNPVSALIWNYVKWIDLENWTDLPLDMPEAPTKYHALNPEYSFKRINDTGNAVNLKVTYRDNFWIVGHPSGKGGFDDVETKRDFELDRLRSPSQYRIYANGERGVLKTGGEFWKQFDPDKHVKPLAYQAAPVHVSLDENGIPYVTVAIWQVIGKDIRQIDELACKAPDNNSPKAARKFISWLHRVNHNDIIFVYGDPSSKKGSTSDELNRSFFDKFIQELRDAGFKVISRVINSAPEVALSGAFIDEIYEFNLENYTITIGDKNKVSIDDYCTVKTGPNGEMLKPTEIDPVTKKKFETHGHFSDAKRYFIIELLKDMWTKWKKKKSNLKLQAGNFR